jgi:predicted 3-demethylubiquinone-9 3-methyltransferase (glyoxalase superfamily)
MAPKNTICLWFDRDALAAAQFYAATFADSAVSAVHHAPADYPSGRAGDVLTVAFTVLGIPCLGLRKARPAIEPQAGNAQPFSFQVATDDQAETDRLWQAILDHGGEPSACGWCKDKWGVSWQITPRVLSEGIADPDPAVARRVFLAMMDMVKIDIAAIEAARRG